MAADLTQKQNNFINRTVEGINTLLDVLGRLDDLQNEYVSLDYGNPETGITDEVLAGSGAQHLDRDMFMAGFTTMDAIDDLMAQGHGTNLQKFRR